MEREKRTFYSEKRIVTTISFSVKSLSAKSFTTRGVSPSTGSSRRMGSGFPMSALSIVRDMGRVENWRSILGVSLSVSAPFVWQCLNSSSMLYLQLPLIKPYVQFSRIRLSNHLLPAAFTAYCLAFWYSFFRRFWIFVGVFSISAIFSSFPSSRNMMKVVPLPFPKVMLSLRYKRYYGHLRLPLRPDGTSSPYIHQLPMAS